MRSILFDLKTVDLLKTALPIIELDAIEHLNSRTPWRNWRYEELAGLAGCSEDWEYPGRIRVAIVGGEGRSWMRQHYRLWWTADPKFRAGLRFTAHPRTGLGWDKWRIGERVARDAAYLAEAAEASIRMQPIFRPEFLEVKRASEKIAAAAVKLLKTRGHQHVQRETRSQGDEETSDTGRRAASNPPKKPTGRAGDDPRATKTTRRPRGAHR